MSQRPSLRGGATLRPRPGRCDIVGDVRLVLDTGVVIAAMRSPSGASAVLLRRIRLGEATAVAGVALALEYEAVCMRPEHRAASGLTRSEAEKFVGAVVAMMEPVKSHFFWRPQLRDPNDELVLEAAINGRAGVLVTFNVKDFAGAARFGVEAVLPREALRRMIQ
jgi:predicted nucleic acid-binding protein